jgi:aspartate/tyrosine/aromatic aminotransferase
MAHRLRNARALLRDELETAGSVREWGHLTEQRGLFSDAGLSPQQAARTHTQERHRARALPTRRAHRAQVERLRDEFHVYLPPDGRFCVAGITATNVGYIASAIHVVTYNSSI